MMRCEVLSLYSASSLSWTDLFFGDDTWGGSVDARAAEVVSKRTGAFGRSQSNRFWRVRTEALTASADVFFDVISSLLMLSSMYADFCRIIHDILLFIRFKASEPVLFTKK